jgi:lipopolysaccharide export system protein LptC
MNDRLSVWFPAGLLFLLALLTFWLDRMVQPPEPRKDGSSRHDPDYWVENFTATRMGPDGMPRHVLVAGKMTHFPDDDSTYLIRPHLTHYAKDLPPMHIEALKGRISSNGEHAYFTDDVKVTREATRTQSELRMTTSYLHVIPDQDFAQTDREVTIRNATTWVTAVGMELNSKTRIIKFLARVKGQHVKQPHQ